MCGELLQAIADQAVIAIENARLFEAFSQAEAGTSRRYGGTGLRLALVRHFAELMGGDVRVASVPGQGSTFTVQVPVMVTETGEGLV